MAQHQDRQDCGAEVLRNKLDRNGEFANLLLKSFEERYELCVDPLFFLSGRRDQMTESLQERISAAVMAKLASVSGMTNFGSFDGRPPKTLEEIRQLRLLSRVTTAFDKRSTGRHYLLETFKQALGLTDLPLDPKAEAKFIENLGLNILTLLRHLLGHGGPSKSINLALIYEVGLGPTLLETLAQAAMRVMHGATSADVLISKKERAALSQPLPHSNVFGVEETPGSAFKVPAMWPAWLVSVSKTQKTPSPQPRLDPHSAHHPQHAHHPQQPGRHGPKGKKGKT